MPDDYARDTAAPRSVRINGTSYQLSKFSPRDLGDLGAHLKDVVPDPRLKAKEILRDFPDGQVAMAIWQTFAEEARDWPPTPLDPKGNHILTQTSEGAAHVLWVLLRKHQPAVDLERARQLVPDVSFEDLILFIDMGFPEPTFDPKSPAPPTTTTEDRGPV